MGPPTPGIFKLPASVPDFGSFSPEQPQRWELEIDGLGALSAAWAPLPGRERSGEREGERLEERRAPCQLAPGVAFGVGNPRFSLPG